MSCVFYGQMQCEISGGSLKEEKLQEWAGMKALVVNEPSLPQLTLTVNLTQEVCELVWGTGADLSDCSLWDCLSPQQCPEVKLLLQLTWNQLYATQMSLCKSAHAGNTAHELDHVAFRSPQFKNYPIAQVRKQTSRCYRFARSHGWKVIDRGGPTSHFLISDDTCHTLPPILKLSLSLG